MTIERVDVSRWMVAVLLLLQLTAHAQDRVSPETAAKAATSATENRLEAISKLLVQTQHQLEETQQQLDRMRRELEQLRAADLSSVGQASGALPSPVVSSSAPPLGTAPGTLADQVSREREDQEIPSGRGEATRPNQTGE